MSLIVNPIQQYFDIDGSPLDQGYIYYGLVNGNPETAPSQVYWDALLTQPAAQPIRTINGFPALNGKPASVYSTNDVSIQVRNKQRNSVFYAATSSISGNSSNISIRTSNSMLTQSDNGKVIVANGTFTQTFDASVALGNGWTVTYVNIGTGIITFDPNLAELIDGLSTELIYSSKSCVINCDGIGLRTTLTPVDTNPIAKGSADGTKLLRNEVDGFTTGTTRVATWQDKNITVAGIDDVNAINPVGSKDTLPFVSSNIQLTSAQLGFLIYNLTGTDYVAALPVSPNTNDAYAFSAMFGKIIINRSGSQVIQALGQLNVTQIILNRGDTLALQWNGTAWIAVTSFKTTLGAFDQTRQDLTASRAVNTNYTNTTGRPVFVNISCIMNAATNIGVTIGSVTYRGSWAAASGNNSIFSTVMLDGETINLSGTNVTSIQQWVEVRT